MFSLADLHCDTLYKCYENGIDLRDPDLHINVQNLSLCDHFIQTFAHFIPEHILDKWAYFCSFLKNSHRLLDLENIKVFKMVDDLTEKRLAVLSIEGGDLFGDLTDAATRIPLLKEQGISFFSMIYNQRNSLGCGCAVKDDTGLTELGRNILFLLEENGIILDVSHSSYLSTDEIINLSNRPVCATHSNAYALTPHRRNLSDRHLKMISERGGLVGVNFYPPFLSINAADLSDICRHILYLTDICGTDQVVFGCDFDGVDYLPNGIENLSSLEKLQQELLQVGCNEALIDKIFYKNLYIFLKENFGR